MIGKSGCVALCELIAAFYPFNLFDDECIYTLNDGLIEHRVSPPPFDPPRRASVNL